MQAFNMIQEKRGQSTALTTNRTAILAAFTMLRSTQQRGAENNV